MKTLKLGTLSKQSPSFLFCNSAICHYSLHSNYLNFPHEARKFYRKQKNSKKNDQNIPNVILKHQSNISIHHLLVWNFGGVCQILVQKAFSTDLSQLYPNIQSDYTKFLARNFPKHARMPANTVILLHKLLVSPFSKGLSYEMSGKPKTFRNSTSFPYVLFQNVNFSN